MSTPVPMVQVSLEAIMAYTDDGEMDHYRPADPTNFCLQLMAFGAAHEGGPRDAFDLAVCIPRWLAEHFDEPLNVHRSEGGRAFFGRGLLLVEKWDTAVIRSAIAEAFALGIGPDWGTAADRVGRLIPWEYDYRRDDQIDNQPMTHVPDGAEPQPSSAPTRSPMLSEPPGVTIGDPHRDWLRIEVRGRTDPNGGGDSGGNWLRATIVGSLGGFRLDIPGAHLRVEEFEQFRTQLRPLSERLTGTASMHSLEGWIDLTVAGRGSGHLEISGGVNDCPGTGNEFRFTIPGYDQTFLPSLIDQLDGIVASFSIVNTTD